MTQIDSEGGLGVSVGFEHWEPLVFKDLETAIHTLGAVRRSSDFEVYSSPDKRHIYSELKSNGEVTYTIFVKEITKWKKKS